MSGGVDSSVAAALLHDEGYEVVGLTMKTWDHATTGGKAEAGGRQIGCCTLDSMNDARAVAVARGFPHYVVDLREEFGETVINRFTSEYLAGRTPNPCVLCNTYVKWDALLQRADALGCTHIATGHYARVGRDSSTGRWRVQRGIDRGKDQSYALWGVAQEHLARTILPLGNRTKKEIRELATAMGLEHVAAKPDSYEICFIPEDDYRGFLRRREPERMRALAGGALVHGPTGRVLGRHEGHPFFTVGQRRRLGVSVGEPLFVVNIEAESNTVTLGPRSWLDGRLLAARGVVFSGAPSLGEERVVWAQTRYAGRAARAVATQVTEDHFEVVFGEAQGLPAPGQAVVLYDEDDCVLAGGWVSKTTTARAA